MRTLIQAVSRLGRNRSGATAIEYAIIAGCIALGIIGAVGQIGQKTADSFTAAQDGFN